MVLITSASASRAASPARLQGHLLSEVDFLLGERWVVHVVAHPRLARDQGQDILARDLLGVDCHWAVQRLVDPGADVRVRLGRKGFRFGL